MRYVLISLKRVKYCRRAKLKKKELSRMPRIAPKSRYRGQNSSDMRDHCLRVENWKIKDLSYQSWYQKPGSP